MTLLHLIRIGAALLVLANALVLGLALFGSGLSSLGRFSCLLVYVIGVGERNASAHCLQLKQRPLLGFLLLLGHEFALLFESSYSLLLLLLLLFFFFFFAFFLFFEILCNSKEKVI